MQTTLQSTLVELGYEWSHFGLLADEVDGVLTEAERAGLVAALERSKEPPEPAAHSNANGKFERARDRFTIGQLGNNYKDAYRRFYHETGHIHPAVVLEGPDGYWYAFGNRGTRRNGHKQPKVVALRGGGVN